MSAWLFHSNQLLLSLNLLLIVGFAATTLMFKSFKKARIEMSSSTKVLLYRTLLISALVFPFIVNLLPAQPLFEPIVKVYSGVGREVSTAANSIPVVNVGTVYSKSVAKEQTSLFSNLALIFIVTSLLGAAFALFRVFKDFYTLKKIKDSGHVIRKIGRTSVIVSDEVATPFAYRFGLSAYVVVPTFIFSNQEVYKSVLKHELQHHRQGDTAWNYLLEAVKAMFFINPIIHIWMKLWVEQQELACDQALIGRGSLSIRQYGSALYQAAHMINQRSESRPLVGTSRMAVRSNFLKRRIQNMFNKDDKQFISRKAVPALAFLIAGIVSASAFALKSGIGDYRITEKKLLNIIKKDQSSGIPLVVDKNVLKMVNRAAGTERGRLYIRQSLKRMKKYKVMIEQKLTAAGLPLELAAIPIAESGYQNYDNGIASGIWSFIPSTARAYGLRVDDEIDERKDPEKETDAAIAYYTHLYNLFGDWHLALTGYMVGESAVKKAIAKHGHRDPFKFARDGHLGREAKYSIPYTMAAIIILRNQHLVEKPSRILAGE